MYQKQEIYELLDKLTLEMLDLIEQEVQCKVNIEKRSNEGRLLLAKSRYTQGPQTVSDAQLPTESSPEFKALLEVRQANDDFLGRKIVAERHNVDKSSGYADPLRWFGLLVPRSLVFAKERFQKSLDLVVEGANIQRQLDNVIWYITKLKSIKCSM